MTTRKVISIATVFLAILTVFRLLWLNFFTTPEQPFASNGVLDLRHWEPLTEHTIKLDGEWEFIPNTFLAQDQNAKNEGNLLHVPSDWTEANSEQTDGYGSYRLQILVSANKDNTYGIHIPSIYSSSEVYVNGELITQSGELGKQKQQYTPVNKPQKAYFTLENTNEIEIIIQAANFDHPFEGGIVRSLEFGLAEPFNKHTNFATNIVILACIVYLLHALYGFLLYFFGNRDKRLFHFSFMILCIILGTLIGERLLFDWIPFNFEWSTKVTYMTMILGGYFLMQIIREQLPKFFRMKLLKPYLVLSSLFMLLILLLPAEYNLMLTLLYSLHMLVPCLLTPYVMYQATAQIDKDNIFLLLAAVAAIGSLIWLLIIEFFNIEMISYPFDLMIAIICFSTYWFKRYFHILNESQTLTVRLQEANKTKDDFLVTVAHEMRNPLHSMINISQTLAEKSDNDKKNVKDLQLLTTVGRQMSFLINDLLDLARLKENRIIIHRENLSIRNVTEAVIEMIRYTTEGKRIELINQIPTTFPPVYADENRVIQIMFNLLYNAVQHSHANEVHISASIENNEANISVADTGVGMKQEFLDRIFEPYEQADKDSFATSGGFGLGLSICKQLVELHEGTLDVHSKLGEGSVFTFNLSLANIESDIHVEQPDIIGNEQLASSVEELNELDIATERLSSAPIRILAIDDDPVNLQVLESIFTTGQYDITTITSGQEALLKLEKGSWDVIIADVMMPHMSGYEFTRLVREHYSISELPILLLTARYVPEDIVTAFKSGANDYVTKPIEGFELKARINTLANLKQSVNEQLRTEAAWLQAQIKPHFLFNTLSTIVSLSEIDITRMNKLLSEFANYLRRSFEPNLQQVVPLEHELELLRSYLYIEQERFGERLHIEWHVDEKVNQIHIPALSIQPLVENAIEHGVLKRAQGGTLQIQITNQKDNVKIAIVDDGIGMDEEQINEVLKSTPDTIRGIGLYNTNRRLKQMFGHGLQITSKPHEGTTVSFAIPKESDPW